MPQVLGNGALRCAYAPYVVALVIGSMVSVHAGEFPFTGYVGVDRAEVASGPGRRFYTTDRLPRGTEVQVFREDEAGWLAIRPPEGSFSWVPADQVQIAEGESIGKVLVATPCWIGTKIERVGEHRSLVSLKAGELVQVLDRRTVTGDTGHEQSWLKIAPPAGEFRYIHGRDISREPAPIAVAQAPIDSPSESSLTPASSEDPTQAEDEPEQFRPSGGAIALDDISAIKDRLQAARQGLRELAQDDGDTTVEQAQFRSEVGQAGDRPISPDGFVPRKRRSSEQLQPQPVPSSNLTRASQPAFSRPKLDPVRPQGSDASRQGATTSTSLNSQAISTEEVTRQLEQLDLDLSLMLAQDRSTWDLAGLRRRAEELVERGARPTDRGTARLLLDKIKQFEDSFDVADFGPVAPVRTEPIVAAAAPAGASPADPRYDGQGWLKPVISRSKPAAPFALVDADGKPLFFITPTPGLNLSRYVNKQIGVYGRRGYMEQLKTPHVMAERVIDLERQWR
jgi:hypothetical protein